MQEVTKALGRATIIVHRVACTVACLLLASCGPRSEPANEAARSSVDDRQAVPASAPTPAPLILLAGSGLIVGDAQGRRPIAFGRPASDALAAARRAYGAPSGAERLEECGAGPLETSRFGGLILAAQDGKFVGWWLDGRHEGPLPATERGIRVGSTRAQLAGAYPVEEFESSLGAEFTAGGLAGLIEGAGQSGTVTHLWAGATCIMR